jgi:hypothetical protein
VSEVPDPLQRLNILNEAVFMTHETSYDLHLDLVHGDHATATSQDLLAESAEIVLQRAPAATATARRLAAQWHEQSVLDPRAAQQTALEMEQEIDRAESVLRGLLSRETAIVAELRALVDESRSLSGVS